jgi:hypothetical protein
VFNRVLLEKWLWHYALERTLRITVVDCHMVACGGEGGYSFFSFLFFFLIGKLHTHPVGL